MKRDPKNCSERGFTLVEIMVVIVILGLLATLVVPNVLGSSAEAEEGVAKTNVQQIFNAATMWATKHRRVPTMEDLREPDEKTNQPALLTQPEDPWGNQYEIIATEGRLSFEVVSYGPDGDPDTEDDIVHPPRDDN